MAVHCRPGSSWILVAQEANHLGVLARRPERDAGLTVAAMAPVRQLPDDPLVGLTEQVVATRSDDGFVEGDVRA